MREVRFPPRVIADLRAIHAFERAEDPVKAALTVARLVDRAMSLRDFPYRGAPRPAYGPRLRMLGDGVYMIFYRVDDTYVVIARILHGSRKITPRMLA